MYILGINAVFYNSAACILKDGKFLAATEDERFTHINHGKRPVPFSTWELPFNATDYCLKIAGIHLNDVDHIAYSFDPWLLLRDKYKGRASKRLPLQPGINDTIYDQWTSP